MTTATIDWDNDYSFAFLLEKAQQQLIDDNQLKARWQDLEPDSSFTLGEIGFNHGFNFLLAWSLWRQYAPPSARLFFFASEHQPVSKADLKRLITYWPELLLQGETLLQCYPVLTPGFHYFEFEQGRVRLTLMLGEALPCFHELLHCGEPILEKSLRQYVVDAWLLRGLTRVDTSSMWNETLMKTLDLLSSKQATSTPPIAISLMKSAIARIPKATPWHCAVSQKKGAKRALILGAGLAGCYTAYALAKRHFKVTLIDASDGVGTGASGNCQAVLYPKLSLYRSPLLQFMLTAFQFATRIYRDFLRNWPIGELNGILQLAYHEKEIRSQRCLATWLRHYPELGVLVNKQQASILAGVDLKLGGLYIPDSGWIDSPLLCEHLIAMPGIDFVANTDVGLINYADGQWYANEHHADVLVIANGYRANQFEQTKHLPLKPIRGQMTSIVSNEFNQGLRMPICADGHVLPSYKSVYGVGATYQSGQINIECDPRDDAQNLERLGALYPALRNEAQVASSWVGVRTATPDYLPLVGRVAQADLFNEQFAGFASNSKRWLPIPGSFYDGLYVCSGFGSRGLTTIPLSAEYLAAVISHEPVFLTNAMIRSLSPARFLQRDLSRSKQTHIDKLIHTK